ncbi:MAG: major facilitator superfamily domain-containing protein [Monoraphidium minutum]|nr:MAG: major facilitator superfamily domain-containing protein [Monoraphidium minutum]
MRLRDVVVADEFFEVGKVLGVRASLEGEDPIVEYRVQWKDGRADTWELATNVSPDLIREFDDRWWNAARKGEDAVMADMLKFSRALLPQVVDDNGRSALHFAAAVNSVPCVQLLLAAGADPDLQDREGYTALHMAAGYSQTPSMMALLEAGADPLLRDGKGQDVPLLIDGLRRKMPPVAQLLQRRMALEQVAAVVTRRLYDEVEVAGILEERPGGEEGEREFLVQFKDGSPDAWVPERDVAPDVLEDYNVGLERAEVAAVVDMLQWGTERQFLVQWADGAKESWEPEEHVPPELVDDLRRTRPELFKGSKRRGGGGGRGRGGGGGGGGGSGRRRRRRGGGAKEQQQQPAAAAAAGGAEASVQAHAALEAEQQQHQQQQPQQQPGSSDAVAREPAGALRRIDLRRAAAERRAERKVLARLLPMLFLFSLVNYIDRSNLAFAAIPLKQQLGVSDRAFGLASGVFFASYAGLQIPSQLLAVRLGGPRMLSLLAVAWGIDTASMAAVRSEGGMLAQRVLLGAAEAGALPTMWLVNSQWFPSHRLTIPSTCVMMAITAINAPLAAGLLSLHGRVAPLSGWQLMFLMEGLPAIALGFCIWFFLSRSISEARWLTPEEKHAWGAAVAATAPAAADGAGG